MKTTTLAKYALYLLCSTIIISKSAFGYENFKKDSQQDNIKVKAEQIMHNSSLLFIENKGQVFDSENKQRTDIKFLLSQKNLTTYFLSDRISFVQTSEAGIDGKRTAKRNDLVFVNSSKNATVSGMDKQNTQYSFQTKGSAVQNSYGYNRVMYKNIYPKIDMVFTTQDGNLKYDIIVHPGGDLKNFLYQYEGAKNITLDKGELVIEYDNNKVKETVPESYITTNYGSGENKKNVEVSYRINNNTIGFKPVNYDKTKDLVIDPTLDWSTYVGTFAPQTTGIDVVNSADFDNDGNLYVVGYTTSFTFPVLSTTYTYLAGEDAFIMKYNLTGALIWSCIFHGEYNERALSVETDPDINRIYFCGYTDSPNMFPIFNPAQPALAGGRDGFLACVDDNCNILWSTYWGGSLNDEANDVYAADFVVSITGYTESMNFPLSLAPADPAYAMGKDAFAALFTNYGLNFYSTYLGGSALGEANGDEIGNGIVHRAEGANYTMFVVGETNNQIYSNILQVGYGGGAHDGFITRIDLDNSIPASAITWSALVGDTGDDVLNDISFGGLVGQFAVVGSTSSASLTDIAWAPLINNTNHKNQYAALTLTDQCGIPIPTVPFADTYDVLSFVLFDSGVLPTGGGMQGHIWDEFGNDIKFVNGGFYISGTSDGIVGSQDGTKWYDYPSDNNYWGVCNNPFQESNRSTTLSDCRFGIPNNLDAENNAFLMKLDSKCLRSYWITPFKGRGFTDRNDEGLGVAVFLDPLTNEVPKVSLVGKTCSPSLIMSNGNPFMSTFTSLNPLDHDGFIATFNDESKFPTFFGGATGVETVTDIARDHVGNYYIVGNTTSGNLNLNPDEGPCPTYDPNTATGFPTFMPTKTTIGLFARPAFPYPLRQTARMRVAGDALGFVIKFDANGNRIFSAFIGFNSTECERDPVSVLPTCVTVDKDNNVIIGGSATAGSNLTDNHTYATDVFPGGTIPSYQPNVSGATDAFLLKLNSQGERLGATYYGGPSSGYLTVPRPNGNDVINDVTTDADGNIIACGTTNSLINITSPTGAFRELNRQNCLMCLLVAGRTDGFVVKFDPTLTNRAWGTYMGGSHDDGLNGITMDAYGNIAVTGFTSSEISPVQYPFVDPGIGVTTEPTPGVATPDVALSRFDPNGNVLWSKVFGAPTGTNTDDIGMAITYNSLNDSYLVTGTTNSTNFIDTDMNPRVCATPVNTDAILIRFDPSNGQRQQTRWFGNCGAEDGDAIVTIGNDVFITGGSTSGPFLPLPGTLKGVAHAGGSDAFIARFTNYCITQDHAFIGGTNNESGTGICEGWFLGYESSPLQICGSSSSSTLGPLASFDPFAFQPNNNGAPAPLAPIDGFSANFSFNTIGGHRKETTRETKQPVIIPMQRKVTLQMYPNPSVNEINVTINGMDGIGVVELTDLTGKVVAKKSANTKEQCRFDTRSLSAGTYIVSVKSNGKAVAQSLFVKE